MAIWKLTRVKYGDEEFDLTEGDELRVGRGSNNSIILTGPAVSRTHCLLQVQKHNVLVTDLKSSNGTFIGLKTIPPNTPVPLEESNTIGIGTYLSSDVKDEEKFVFKLNRIHSISNRLQFQNEDEISNSQVYIDLAKLNGCENSIPLNKETSPIICTKHSLKRKVDVVPDKILKENKSDNSSSIIDNRNNNQNDIITILSDIENDDDVIFIKKTKHEEIKNDSNVLEINTIDNFKTGNNDVEYEPISTRQGMFQYDEEPIEIDNDSDSDTEKWQIRLSQSSPGKPFFKAASKIKTEDQLNDSSYSQIDDPIIDLNQDYYDEEDFIKIEPATPNSLCKESESIDEGKNNKSNEKDIKDRCDDHRNELLCTSIKFKEPPSDKPHKDQDIIIKNYINEKTSVKDPKKPHKTLNVVSSQIQNNDVKIVKVTEPRPLATKTKSEYKESKSKVNKNSRKKQKAYKILLSSVQKEERKKKLRELANKEKEYASKEEIINITENMKQKVNVKVTTSNRGAFLTNTVEFVVKPLQPKDDNMTNENEIECQKKSDKHKSPRRKKKRNTKTQNKRENNAQESRKEVINEPNSVDGIINKPTSTRQLSPSKLPKKTVRFTDMPPNVLEFQILEGNKMKRISSIKSTLFDSHKPVFSLKRASLMKILRWNPQWLDEQKIFSDPPPILGNSKPTAMLQAFQNHKQYMHVVGDLILMEIWEFLSNSYMNFRNENSIDMRLEYTVSMDLHDPCELCNFGVDVSVPKSDTQNVPRVGEIMLVTFGQDDVITNRFFFVNNVRCLPSPPNNVNAFFNVSLQTSFSERLNCLRVGQVVKGKRLAYINNELSLIDAIEYLARTPLAEVVLHPSPLHFQPVDIAALTRFNQLQWCQSLNPSQKVAVGTALSAALSDYPSIKMIQGPPGTGKSRVICSIIMTYLYDLNNKRRQDRGKLLICATSNAAIDEIVVRLLEIRKDLPKSERFRMVRVGRMEAMHSQARNISLQTLTEREMLRNKDSQNPALADEISQLEAKVNMWRTLVLEAKTPERAAYCEGRVAHFTKRMALIRGDAPIGGNQNEAEHRILSGAEIVLTTLGSAHTFKMRWLKRQISLCIVDEAGQATEPEALIPLTLDVTRLVLVGDPQQLPGFIASQRAREYGLGESLFARLASAAEGSNGGVVLLTRQYRMHPAIADYPNRAFYDERIISETPSVGVAARFNLLPYCMLAVASGDKRQIVVGSNELEAWAVAQLVTSLRASVFGSSLSLAVITPYNMQRDLIRRHLRTLISKHNLESALGEVEVNTVDSFQGQERDVIVVSLGRLQGVGFLTDVGRMNVMLTRARHGLYLLLHPNAFVKNNQWRTLIDDAKRRNLYRTLPASVCQPPPSDACSADSQTILRYISA